MDGLNNQNLENNMVGTTDTNNTVPTPNTDSVVNVAPVPNAGFTNTTTTTVENNNGAFYGAPAPQNTQNTPNNMPGTYTEPQTTDAQAAPTNNGGSKLPIILGVVIVLLLAALVYFAFIKKDDCDNSNKSNGDTCKNLDEEKIIAEYAKKAEFLDIAKEYVNKAQKMWDNGIITCQNQYAKGVDKENIPFVKPSELEKTDAYGGTAVYYLFVDNESSDEIDFGINTDRKIAGWVKIGMDGKVYAALSDGTNYLVDDGNNKLEFKDVTYKNIISTGNGNNYQFKNGMILGSQTDGNGWGIGDYVIMSDGDDSNNGIYMSNGDKNTGWTPYCK